MRSVTTVIAICTFVVAGAAGGPAFAEGGGANCGDLLTHNTRLTHDLVCTGGGITVGRGVTLDLARHTITAGDPNAVGVIVGDASRVSNGVLSGFATAVISNVESLSAVVDRVTFRDNGVAVSANFLRGLTLRDDTFERNQTAVDALSAVIGVIHSAFRNNGAALQTPNGQVTVRDSTFERNGSVAMCSQGILDIGNSVMRNNAAGVYLFQCDTSQISDSTFDNDGAAVTLEAFLPSFAGTIVTRSSFTRNTTGIALYNVIGLGNGGSISNNRFSGNGTGIYASDAGCGGCAAGFGPYAITGNVFTANSVDGVHLDSGAAPANFANNVAKGNGAWALYVDPTTGSVDGGGNVATGNGQPTQCYGVTCSH